MFALFLLLFEVLGVVGDGAGEGDGVGFEVGPEGVIRDTGIGVALSSLFASDVIPEREWGFSLLGDGEGVAFCGLSTSVIVITDRLETRNDALWRDRLALKLMLDQLLLLLQLLINHSLHFTSTNRLGFGLLAPVKSERQRHSDPVLALLPLGNLGVVSTTDPAGHLVSGPIRRTEAFLLRAPGEVVVAVVAVFAPPARTIIIRSIIAVKVVLLIILAIILVFITALTAIIKVEVELDTRVLILVILALIVGVEVLMLSEVLVQPGLPPFLDIFCPSFLLFLLLLHLFVLGL